MRRAIDCTARAFGNGSSLPGRRGKPASFISFLAWALSPILVMAALGGPMKVRPTCIQTSAR